jgi:hypothetical protein
MLQQDNTSAFQGFTDEEISILVGYLRRLNVNLDRMVDEDGT